MGKIISTLVEKTAKVMKKRKGPHAGKHEDAEFSNRTPTGYTFSAHQRGNTIFYINRIMLISVIVMGSIYAE